MHIVANIYPVSGCAVSVLLHFTIFDNHGFHVVTVWMPYHCFGICCLFQGNEIRPKFRPLPLGRTGNAQCAFSVLLAFSTFVHPSGAAPVLESHLTVELRGAEAAVYGLRPILPSGKGTEIGFCN